VKPSEDATWIPGYWAWDDQREDFIWVSGVYRVPPPERRWVPGYWQDAADGYQWIPGFWTSIQADQVEYLPEPPESLERGPSSPAPSQEYFWVSGCWQYQNGRYAWRSGYGTGPRRCRAGFVGCGPSASIRTTTPLPAQLPAGLRPSLLRAPVQLSGPLLLLWAECPHVPVSRLLLLPARWSSRRTVSVPLVAFA
jgi:hypothetical protein